MNTVRHNGRALDPAPYERGFGVRSLIIRVANWLRMRLELFVAEQVLRLRPPPVKKTARVLEVPTSPEPRVPATVRELFHVLPPGTPFSRAERYRRDAENPLMRVDESPMLKRALAHALRHTDRSVRYYTARGTKTLVPEDMFMKVTDENDIPNAPAPGPTSGDTVDDALRRLREDAAMRNLRNADFNLGRSERYLSVPGGLPKLPRR